MKPLQLAAVCASCFAGCLAGSWLAFGHGIVVHAQPRPILDPQRSVNADEKLVVPDTGLRIVGNRNEPLGFFSVTSEGLSLVLNSRAGRPGVTLQAGSGGHVVVGGTASEAGVAIQNSQGLRAATVITANQAKSELTSKDRKLRMEVGSEALFAFPGTGSSPIFELRSLSDGGALSMKSRTGQELMNVTTNLDYGSMWLSSVKDKGKFIASGRGQASVSRMGQSLWAALPKEVGTGEGLPPGDGSTGGGG